MQNIMDQHYSQFQIIEQNTILYYLWKVPCVLLERTDEILYYFQGAEKKTLMGLLDIYGFEIFESNRWVCTSQGVLLLLPIVTVP